jgi:hypothetical protein
MTSENNSYRHHRKQVSGAKYRQQREKTASCSVQALEFHIESRRTDSVDLISVTINIPGLASTVACNHPLRGVLNPASPVFQSFPESATIVKIAPS